MTSFKTIYLLVFTLIRYALAKVHAKYRLTEDNKLIATLQSTKNYDINSIELVRNVEPLPDKGWSHVAGETYEGCPQRILKNQKYDITIDNVQEGYVYSFKIILDNGNLIYTESSPKGTIKKLKQNPSTKKSKPTKKDTEDTKSKNKKTNKNDNDKNKSKGKEDKETNEDESFISKKEVIITLAIVGSVILFVCLFIIFYKGCLE